MKLEHEFRVPVPIEQAWDVLLDVERIAPCMPGASVESFDGETVHGRVKVKVGPIQVTYGGVAKFIEKDLDAHQVTLEASGKEARGSGTAAATIVSVLTDEGGSTRVNVTTELAITGKPAQFGRGVMVEVGNKLIGRFADCLAMEIGIGSSGSGAGVADDSTQGDPGVDAAAGSPDAAASSSAAADTPGGASAAGEVLADAAGGDAVVIAPDGGEAAGRADDDGVGAVGAGTGAGGAAASLPGASARVEDSPSPWPRPLAAAPAGRSAHLPGEDEALDLLEVGGAAILKRVVPLVVGLVVLFALWRHIRRR
jgi:carbon monoxide dehydrogenase subunit G